MSSSDCPVTGEIYSAAGGRIDRIEFCPHENGACDCRKPGLKLYREAIAELEGRAPQVLERRAHHHRRAVR